MFGALGAVKGIAVLAGTVAAGFLGPSVGIIPVLAVQGASYVVAGFVMLVAWRGATSIAGSLASRPARPDGDPPMGIAHPAPGH